MKPAEEILLNELVLIGHAPEEIESWKRDDPKEYYPIIAAMKEYAREAVKEREAKILGMAYYENLPVGCYVIKRRDIVNLPELELP